MADLHATNAAIPLVSTVDDSGNDCSINNSQATVIINNKHFIIHDKTNYSRADLFLCKNNSIKLCTVGEF